MASSVNMEGGCPCPDADLRTSFGDVLRNPRHDVASIGRASLCHGHVVQCRAQRRDGGWSLGDAFLADARQQKDPADGERDYAFLRLLNWSGFGA